MVELGKLEITSSQKTGLVFTGAFVIAGLVLSTMVFPFWHLIREDLFEDVVILSNDDGTCYVETVDNIPKTIDDCNLQAGDTATIKFGDGLAWATIVSP
ncbi:MAG TPA: hypothetical protein QF518_03600 [Nitrosopumilus sp.]|jgi:hypothetical protein|nr:hypothetical protein [Nitrosopumilus sp.]HJL67103.1 hypothetical protein [Nitrosopumilus sp.]HJM25508.1 hypothetical protein [Nitrosopumilus sp.]HJO31696.1 hypothetical protein [Nitrosopumilus sp.]|tara:strand:+ start:446 stop:742 length:297 start_codon:yes stop_codon:yes gene_type:complete